MESLFESWTPMTVVHSHVDITLQLFSAISSLWFKYLLRHIYKGEILKIGLAILSTSPGSDAPLYNQKTILAVPFRHRPNSTLMPWLQVELGEGALSYLTKFPQ